MKTTIKILLAVFLISITSFGIAQKTHNKSDYIHYKAIKNFPQATGFVNDFESLFTTQQIQELDSIIKVFETLTTNQICIVSIESYKPYESLQDFTTDLGTYWGVGQRDKNNGLIITVSKNSRKIWIGTGLGTQKILTDEIIQNVIDTKIIPYFKEDKYFDGIKSGLLELIALWK